MKMIIAGVVIVICVLVWTGKKSVHTEIIINSSKENVWGVLTDMEKYPEWNPVMQLVEGDVAEGNKVKYLFTQDENRSYEVGTTVHKYIPNELLNQKGGIPLVLSFNHKYILEENDNFTKVIIHEDYSGISVNFWNPTEVENAYTKLNKALKKRVEQLN